MEDETPHPAIIGAFGGEKVITATSGPPPAWANSSTWRP
jgi:hypothetical protein